VITTVATRGEGLDKLAKMIETARPARRPIEEHGELGRILDEAASLLPERLAGRRGLAAMLLAGDPDLEQRLRKIVGAGPLAEIDNLRRTLTTGTAETVAARFTRARLRLADRIILQSCRTVRKAPSSFRHLSGLTTHPIWGVPVVLAVLWITYQVVGVFGAGTAVDFMESTVFGQWINPLVIKAASFLPWAFARELLVGEYGIFTMAITYAVAIVLPIVFFFFVIFGILEDSGYLPRLAIMLNRVMKMMGLNGKAVLPMVLGLGCDTMATVTSRILETKKEKLLVTFLLALGVPCSAQLAVVFALTSSLSPWALVIWGGVVLSTLFLVGWAAARVIPGDNSDFILEIPPLRMPQIGNILTKTLARLEWYLKEAVPLFILGTLLLFVMAKLGLLVVLERAAAPVVVNILSLPPQAAGAFVVGFLRRDYGAVFLADAARSGALTGVQVVVALVTLTLFIPCVANFFMMLRERGWKTAVWIAAFVFPFAFAVGGLVNWGLHFFQVTL
jgi:ferrous iron transport protein B